MVKRLFRVSIGIIRQGCKTPTLKRTSSPKSPPFTPISAMYISANGAIRWSSATTLVPWAYSLSRSGDRHGSRWQNLLVSRSLLAGILRFDKPIHVSSTAILTRGRLYSPPALRYFELMHVKYCSNHWSTWAEQALRKLVCKMDHLRAY